MLKSCKYCGKIHDSKTICEAKKRDHALGASAEIAKFRSSYAWQKKRERIKERDRYLCQACLARGVITYLGIEVHHIKPLRSNFEERLDDDNLISLCDACHKEADRGKINAKWLKEIAGERNAGIPPRLGEVQGKKGSTPLSPCVNKRFPK